MRYIELTQGKKAIVDDEDFEWLNQWKWNFHRGGRTDYASRMARINNKRKCIYMHRLILGAKKGVVSDHINGNKLDNRRCNLRFATISQNAMNSDRKNKNGYKGVAKYNGGWRAQLRKNYKNIVVSGFKKPEDAAKEYDHLALIYFGKFAKLNFN